MIPQLSENYIADYVARWILPPPDSVFQVIGTKKIEADQTNLKYRLCLSDGVHRFSQAMLQLADKQTPVPTEYSVIRMKDDGDRPNSIFKMNNKLIWIVRDFEILAEGGTDVEGRIGNPTALNPSQLLSEPEDQPPAPATPSPSRGTTETSAMAAPPAGPSKRTHEDSRGQVDDRTKQARRALFTDAGSSNATQSISSLSPFTNKFTIKARVTKKSELREYHNSRGSGHVFDVILQDASGEIKASAFNDAAVRFSQIFKENKVFFVSQAPVKSSNPAFNPTKHPYELSLTPNSEVVEVRESLSQDVPAVHYDYVQISDLTSTPDSEQVDVIGICSGVDDLREITVRSTGRQVKKRDIRLTDTTDSSITVTLWGPKAEEFSSDDFIGKPVRIRKAKVTDFNGKSLTLNFSSSIEPDPKGCPEANVLLEWWARRSENQNGVDNSFSRPSGMSAASISGFSTLFEIQSDFREVSASDPAKYHKFEAYVVDIKTDNVMYQACPHCNKKVVDLANGNFRCEKCATTKPEFSWRYIMRAVIADMTEYQWVTLFDDTAQKLVGLSAQDLRAIFDRDPEQFRGKLHSVKYSLFEFVSKTKCENYNDEKRIKMMINNATPIPNHSNKERLERLRREIQSAKTQSLS